MYPAPDLNNPGQPPQDKRHQSIHPNGPQDSRGVSADTLGLILALATSWCYPKLMNQARFSSTSSPSDVVRSGAGTQHPAKIHCAKMHGAGNDFIVLPTPGLCPKDLREFVQSACHRRRGVGADGVVLLAQEGPATFGLRFYNCDGGRVELCLNGARCAALRLTHLGWLGSKTGLFNTHLGPMQFRIRDPLVDLTFDLQEFPKRTVEISVSSQSRPAHFVDLADPHLVVPFTPQEMDSLDFEAFARPIRWSQQFDQGTNVHAVARESKERILIRSYERGIESETLACGSGCVAAAITLDISTAEFRTRGGDQLFLNKAQKGGQWKITGPAVLTAELEIPVPSATPDAGTSDAR